MHLYLSQLHFIFHLQFVFELQCNQGWVGLPQLGSYGYGYSVERECSTWIKYSCNFSYNVSSSTLYPAKSSSKSYISSIAEILSRLS